MTELYIFIIFILTGILVSILFDIFRILRISFKTSDFITNIEDIIFWVLTTILLLYTIFKFNDGQLRSYIFLGILIGITMYLKLFSKTFIHVNVKIIEFFKFVLIKIIDIIKLPIIFIFKQLRRFLIKPIYFTFINVRKSLKSFIFRPNKRKNIG